MSSNGIGVIFEKPVMFRDRRHFRMMRLRGRLRSPLRCGGKVLPGIVRTSGGSGGDDSDSGGGGGGGPDEAVAEAC